MKIKVLGCSGGIGPGLKTTSFLINDSVLLDAGSGLDSLSIEEMLNIRHVLLTHAHIDHILGLPLMLAMIYDRHQHQIQVHALPSVVQALKHHIFNWTIWPDFTRLPEHAPIVCLNALNIAEELQVGQLSVMPLPALHPSPGVGYFLASGGASFAFTGDSSFHPPFWSSINRLRPDMVIADISFTAEANTLAADSGHMTIDQLSSALSFLDYQPEIRPTHFKVGFEQELTELCKDFKSVVVKPLVHGEEIILAPDLPKNAVQNNPV